MSSTRPIPPGAWERVVEHVRTKSMPTAAMLSQQAILDRWEEDGAVVILILKAFKETFDRQPAKKQILLEAVQAVFGAGAFPLLEVSEMRRPQAPIVPPPAPQDLVTSGPGLDLFPVRQTTADGQTYLSVIDVIAHLTDSAEPGKYWSAMKARDRSDASKEGLEGQLSTICRQLKLEAADGKKYLTDCANAEGILRIIQSIPSPKPKVEQFKRWLAKVGHERLQETNDPELAVDRIQETYRAQGYSEAWIAVRMRSVHTRKGLTNEWDQRGVTDGKGYGKLTSIIARGTFGVTPTEHKDVKSLAPKHNLRDHMTDIELALTVLGEAASTAIHQSRDSQGARALARDAQEAGDIAGRARRDLESKTGIPVVSPGNFLRETRPAKRLKDAGSEPPTPDA